MNPVPHSSWAKVYDLAYERTFGSLYRQLTESTLQAISRLYPKPARIVDFGAGTGRLSIPLARAGHEVIAVDPCAEMLEQLLGKADGVEIATAHCTMADFETSTPADLALGVFTVLLYLLEEDDLRQSLTAARRALKGGGGMLVDVASSALFRGFEAGDDRLTRRVSISASGENRFIYEEDLTLANPDGSLSRFEDRFTIRLWKPEEVLAASQASGFTMENDLSDDFAGSGSRYFLLRAV